MDWKLGVYMVARNVPRPVQIYFLKQSVEYSTACRELELE